jgi:hypothetical protein
MTLSREESGIGLKGPNSEQISEKSWRRVRLEEEKDG